MFERHMRVISKGEVSEIAEHPPITQNRHTKNCPPSCLHSEPISKETLICYHFTDIVKYSCHVVGEAGEQEGTKY